MEKHVDLFSFIGRKQVENEILREQVQQLEAENGSLRAQIDKLAEPAKEKK